MFLFSDVLDNLYNDFIDERLKYQNMAILVFGDIILGDSRGWDHIYAWQN